MIKYLSTEIIGIYLAVHAKLSYLTGDELGIL